MPSYSRTYHPQFSIWHILNTTCDMNLAFQQPYSTKCSAIPHRLFQYHCHKHGKIYSLIFVEIYSSSSMWRLWHRAGWLSTWPYWGWGVSAIPFSGAYEREELLHGGRQLLWFPRYHLEERPATGFNRTYFGLIFSLQNGNNSLYDLCYMGNQLIVSSIFFV